MPKPATSSITSLGNKGTEINITSPVEGEGYELSVSLCGTTNNVMGCKRVLDRYCSITAVHTHYMACCTEIGIASGIRDGLSAVVSVFKMVLKLHRR